MNKKIKKKKDREERIRQQRIRKEQMKDFSRSDKKRGRIGLYLIGVIILLAAALVFTNMR